MPAFERHDRIRHMKSGGLYVVLAGPKEGVRIESRDEPAYLYQEFWVVNLSEPRIWVRPASEMEDGRFALVNKTTNGAEGRL